MDHVLGIDLGGTSLRAGLVADDGRITTLAARRHRIEAEAEPEDWWRALLAILADLDLTTVRAIGLSGFTRRAESEYDPFGAAHSSTSISAGLGMAAARDLAGGRNNVIAVIGDGAMSAGMAYEAMNNAGARKERLIVILNDNDMSIAPPKSCWKRPSPTPLRTPPSIPRHPTRRRRITP
eukprot:gene41890-biopygen28389